MNNYGFKTKCRAAFIYTLGIYTNQNIKLNDDLLSSIHCFCNDLLKEDTNKYIDLVDTIIYFKFENRKFKSFETDETKSDLYNLLEAITSYKTLVKIYDDIGYENVEKISQLAIMFVNYLNSFLDVPYYKEIKSC